METKTMLMIVLCLVLVCISQCNGDECYCTCCTGNFCDPTFQGTIPVSSCASSSCPSLCQNKYSQCTTGPGRASYQCRGGSVTYPNWAGTFDIGNRCDTATCCCVRGPLIMTKVNTNQLHVQYPLAGMCPAGASSVDTVLDMPTGYTTEITFLNNIVQVTLSQDTKSIQFYNPSFPSCSEVATRSKALSSTTINLTLVFLLSGIMSFMPFLI